MKIVQNSEKIEKKAPFAEGSTPKKKN